MIIAGWAWHARNRVAGVARYRDPRSYFGPGGLDEAEALCAEANRDLPAFLQPPAEAEVRRLRRERTGDRRDGVRIEDWSLDSPLPSGIASNDRIRFRLYLPAGSTARDAIVMFHHPVYQRHWGLWSWFLHGLFRRVAVVVLVAPYHFERIEPGRFPGEGAVNPNPARLFEAIRQWCWDHEAVACGRFVIIGGCASRRRSVTAWVDTKC